MFGSLCPGTGVSRSWFIHDLVCPGSAVCVLSTFCPFNDLSFQYSVFSTLSTSCPVGTLSLRHSDLFFSFSHYGLRQYVYPVDILSHRYYDFTTVVIFFTFSLPTFSRSRFGHSDRSKFSCCVQDTPIEH